MCRCRHFRSKKSPIASEGIQEIALLRGWGKEITGLYATPYEIEVLNDVAITSEHMSYRDLQDMDWWEYQLYIEIMSAYNKGLEKKHKDQTKGVDKKKPAKR